MTKVAMNPEGDGPNRRRRTAPDEGKLDIFTGSGLMCMGRGSKVIVFDKADEDARAAASREFGDLGVVPHVWEM